MRQAFSGFSEGESFEDALGRLSKMPAMPPFDPALVAFVSAFSDRVRALPGLRSHPELATLAHWFRGSALRNMARLVEGDSRYVTRPRGLVFHIAPSNVDALFAYGWLMSLLCGNTNIARLSQKSSDSKDWLVGIVRDLTSDPMHANVARRSLLLTYDHSDSATADISSVCHARLIWGGDSTVQLLRTVSLSPLAVEMAFPDRFGVAVIKSSALLHLSDEDLSQLAQRFCNDMLWFGQQACSSPRTVYWVGQSSETRAAKARFWSAVSARAPFVQEDDAASRMARISDAFLIAAKQGNISLKEETSLATYPLHLEAEGPDASSRELQSGYGMVLESSISDLSTLSAFLDDRDQTLIEFGFDDEEIRELVGSLTNRAIDRIVPMGRALDFSSTWDGMDLFSILCRRINLRAS